MQAINGTKTKRFYFPANDETVITSWEPYIGYLAHIDGSEELGTGTGKTRLEAIADLADMIGRDD